MAWNPVVWFDEARQFVGEVRSEFRKVTFPTQKETVAGTIGVLVIVAIVTLALGGVDFLLSKVTQLVIQ